MTVAQRQLTASRGYPAHTGPIATSAPERKRPEDRKPLPLDARDEVPGLQMPGEGKSKVFCGAFQSAVACPRGAPGGSQMRLSVGQAGHTLSAVPKTCNRAACEKCWPFAIRRMAVRAEAKLEAVSQLYCTSAARHFTLSPDPGDSIRRLRSQGVDWIAKAHRHLYAMLRRNGLRGGAVVFHPWRCKGHGKDRYRTSQRFLSPHFHVLAWGRVTDTRRFKATEGWVVHNHDAKRPAGKPRSVIKTLLYLLDHCGLVVADGRAKDAVRYFGIATQVRIVNSELVKAPHLCDGCGTTCRMYELEFETHDPEDVELRWGEDLGEAERVFRVTTYARSKNAKAPPGAPDQVTVGHADVVPEGGDAVASSQAVLGGAAA